MLFQDMEYLRVRRTLSVLYFASSCSQLSLSELLVLCLDFFWGVVWNSLFYFQIKSTLSSLFLPTSQIMDPQVLQALTIDRKTAVL